MATKSKGLALYVSSHSIFSNQLPLFKARRSGKHIGKLFNVCLLYLGFFFLQILRCSSLGHYIPWKGGIQHGDISVSNLMHRNVTGVFNDFDLAQLTTPDNVYPRGFDRTATTPFLALDLLAKDAQDGKVERR